MGEGVPRLEHHHYLQVCHFLVVVPELFSFAEGRFSGWGLFCRVPGITHMDMAAPEFSSFAEDRFGRKGIFCRARGASLTVVWL